MSRTRKIALIGAKGYNRDSTELRIDCFVWDKISKIKNLRDYDTVILNLLSLEKKDSVDWAIFFNLLNHFSMKDILKPGGSIVVIGDPRITVPVKQVDSEGSLERSFLEWTGITFYWDNTPGDTIMVNRGIGSGRFKEYLKNLHSWNYSLAGCTINDNIFKYLFNVDVLKKAGLKPHLCENIFAVNRYDCSLVFSVQLAVGKWENMAPIGHSGWKNEYEFGPVIFLPKIDLSIDETLTLVLRDICEIETCLPEPDWIVEMKPPGQEGIDNQIHDIENKIRSLNSELQDTKSNRDSVRDCLKLLYDRGESLEKVVRETLRKLGADVEEPANPGKEDGWMTVRSEDSTFEGVLEVKGTKNSHFNERGLKQLLDWINRGVEKRKKKYKGIFVGNSSIEIPWQKRQEAFSESWKESAELHEIVAIKTSDIYSLHLLNEAGKLNKEEFWHKLFSTNGVFDIKPFIGSIQQQGE